MSKETKRGYKHIDPEKYRSWNKPPEIIYNTDGTVKDRRTYDRWYYQNVKKRKYKHEPWKEKQKRYDKLSEDYWRAYCLDNGLDPETWEEVKKQVQHRKSLRKQRRRYGLY